MILFLKNKGQERSIASGLYHDSQPTTQKSLLAATYTFV